MVGKKFGRWTVIQFAGYQQYKCGQKHKYWLCKCECGTERTVNENTLKNGNSKSCGCLRKDDSIRFRKQNQYEFKESYVIGRYCNSDREFLIDTSDYSDISRYTWTDRSGYAVAYIDGILTYMHTYLLKTPSGKIIDHINHNTSDNRRCNLRIISQRQNTMNCSLSKNNSSGHTGVSYLKSCNKWRAYITVNRKQISLGSYDDVNQAAEARRKAEEKYFEQYSFEESKKISSSFSL